jgi:hypothetical protein
MRYLLAILLLVVNLFGAIGASEPTAEIASTSNASSYSFAAFTPSANATLVVLVFATGTTATATMSGGSLSWTRETSILYNTTDTAYLFWANTGASPGSTTITFDCTGDNATGVTMSVTEFTGSDVTTPNPIRQFKTAATTAANPSTTFDTGMNTNNGYVSGFGMPRNPPTSTPPASWTEMMDTGYSTPTAGASSAYRAGGETAAAITFTSSSAAYGMISAEVYVAGAGPVASAQGAYRRRVR